jgi:hypothetical protein
VKARLLSEFLIVLVGPMGWAAHFFILYGAEALVCTRATSPSHALRWINLVATAVALCALAGLLIRQYRTRRSKRDDAGVFLRDASAWLALISIGGICGMALSAWHLPPCLPPTG